MVVFLLDSKVAKLYGVRKIQRVCFNLGFCVEEEVEFQWLGDV
jgi:hypothetical protein